MDITITTGERITIEMTVAETNTHIATFSTGDLVVNRHYSVIVTASNIAGEATSYDSLSEYNGAP